MSLSTRSEAEKLIDALDQQLHHIDGDAVTVSDIVLSPADARDLSKGIDRQLHIPSLIIDWRKHGFKGGEYNEYNLLSDLVIGTGAR